MMNKVYLASPFGFSEECAGYRMRLVAVLNSLGFEIHDPWDNDRTNVFDKKLADLEIINNYEDRCKAYLVVAREMGEANETAIRECGMLVAVLDGMEPDSGTVSELGFATGIGRKCYGIRTDTRDAGDFPGVPINLQVLRFIEGSGGILFRSLEEMEGFFGSDEGDN